MLELSDQEFKTIMIQFIIWLKLWFDFKSIDFKSNFKWFKINYDLI